MRHQRPKKNEKLSKNSASRSSNALSADSRFTRKRKSTSAVIAEINSDPDAGSVCPPLGPDRIRLECTFVALFP